MIFKFSARKISKVEPTSLTHLAGGCEPRRFSQLFKGLFPSLILHIYYNINLRENQNLTAVKISAPPPRGGNAAVICSRYKI